ncbi:KilA-N domain-containing protein [Teichococcus vastitatis]|uniref:KilA-N domain-containing protein n=1 Tax=Teichococcus vastitatis TaxID=2307076 RepID=A0ABS9W6S2_9PROT|nr:KilA-N domain-containing protein [Pseudoroseomonas vastitatis]MCI0754999.1 KilA-N domain-containing protein [Pseudoroseomonas vastitatis]
MTPTDTLHYQGTTIRLRGAMLNLTDMWKAAGSPGNRRPADWLALDDTKRLRSLTNRHLRKCSEPAQLKAGLAGIDLDTDGLVATVRGIGGGTWAHWHLALAYGRSLSTAFHLWCNTVVRAAMEKPENRPTRKGAPWRSQLVQSLQELHRRFDILDRHAADLMFLQLSSQDLLLGRRRDFSKSSQATITRAVQGEPFEGRCPCCGRTPVLDAAGCPVGGAEFDHFFHRGLNRPEHGWLICTHCHAELDPWRLPRPVRPHARVPRLPGRRAGATAATATPLKPAGALGTHPSCPPASGRGSAAAP